MSEPIQSGDLVYVSRSCCAPAARPSIFRVGSVAFFDYAICLDCGVDGPKEVYAQVNQTGRGLPLSWLRRIDPLPEWEGVKEADKVPA